MTQLSVAEAIRVNKMNPTSKNVALGDRVRALEGSANIVTGTEAQVPICGADGVPDAQTVSGDVTVTAAGVTSIGSSKVLAGKAKIVNRDITVAIGQTSGTVTNAADIDGVPLGAHFTAAADATATEIRGVRFIAATGALTVLVNAAATAATVIRVPILQAA